MDALLLSPITVSCGPLLFRFPIVKHSSFFLSPHSAISCSLIRLFSILKLAVTNRRLEHIKAVRDAITFITVCDRNKKKRQTGICAGTWSETSETQFLLFHLKYYTKWSFVLRVCSVLDSIPGTAEMSPIKNRNLECLKWVSAIFLVKKRSLFAMEPNEILPKSHLGRTFSQNIPQIFNLWFN